MTKDQVFAVVTKHLKAAVDDLDDTRIRPEASMKELGANSLDIVEVVSSSMRELKIKVPRSELSKLTNIGGLVDLLHGIAETSAERAHPPAAHPAPSQEQA